MQKKNNNNKVIISGRPINKIDNNFSHCWPAMYDNHVNIDVKWVNHKVRVEKLMNAIKIKLKYGAFFVCTKEIENSLNLIEIN